LSKLTLFKIFFRDVLQYLGFFFIISRNFIFLLFFLICFIQLTKLFIASLSKPEQLTAAATLKKGKVFLSTESEVEPEFNSFKLPDRPELLHSILAYAKMYVGESQTMTSEAAVMGTPALKCNTFAGRLSVPNELEQKYGLCYSFLPEDFDKMLSKIDEFLAMPDLKAEWQIRQKKMLNENL